MSKVIFQTGISLDGYMAGDNRGPQNPLGDDGTTIHNWMYKEKAFWEFLGMEGGEEDTKDGELIRELASRTGAYIMGKRMFEEGEGNWPEDLYKASVYVLTHEKREPWVQKGSTTFYFTNESIESVLEKAKKDAKGKDVRIQGGGNIIQQYLNAGLIDEMIIDIAPVFLGSGIRLFDNIDKTKMNLEIVQAIHSSMVTHIRYKVTKK